MINLNPLEKVLMAVVWTLAIFGFGYIAAYSDAREDAQAIEAARTAAALQKQADENAIVLAAERTLRRQLQTAYDAYRQEKEDAKKSADALIADLRADNKRLRIPVRRPVCPVGADSGGSAAGGTGGEGYADLTPGASEFLIRLTDRGDDAIRKHAKVADLYEQLRAACERKFNQEK